MFILDLRSAKGRRKSLEDLEKRVDSILSNQLESNRLEPITELLFLQSLKTLMGLQKKPCFPPYSHFKTLKTSEVLVEWRGNSIKRLLNTPLNSENLTRNFLYLRLLHNLDIKYESI